MKRQTDSVIFKPVILLIHKYMYNKININVRDNCWVNDWLIQTLIGAICLSDTCVCVCVFVCVCMNCKNCPRWSFGRANYNNNNNQQKNREKRKVLHSNIVRDRNRVSKMNRYLVFIKMMIRGGWIEATMRQRWKIQNEWENPKKRKTTQVDHRDKKVWGISSSSSSSE